MLGLLDRDVRVGLLICAGVPHLPDPVSPGTEGFPQGSVSNHLVDRGVECALVLGVLRALVLDDLRERVSEHRDSHVRSLDREASDTLVVLLHYCIWDAGAEVRSAGSWPPKYRGERGACVVPALDDDGRFTASHAGRLNGTRERYCRHAGVSTSIRAVQRQFAAVAEVGYAAASWARSSRVVMRWEGVVAKETRWTASAMSTRPKLSAAPRASRSWWRKAGRSSRRPGKRTGSVAVTTSRYCVGRTRSTSPKRAEVLISVAALTPPRPPPL